jgi:hypothetical protein
MSQLTFNIADYQPLFRSRVHHEPHADKPHSAFVLLSSNSEPREYEAGWFDPHPSVIDIRSVREEHRSAPLRGKILRFSNPASPCVYSMPSQESCLPEGDDPGPMVA